MDRSMKGIGMQSSLMRYGIGFFVAIGMAWSVSPRGAYAHGLDVDVYADDASLIVQVRFEDGGPVAGASVRIDTKAAGGESQTLVELRTPPSGDIAVPLADLGDASAGDIVIEVSDAEGHHEDVAITRAQLAERGEAGKRRHLGGSDHGALSAWPTWTRQVIGLAAIALVVLIVLATRRSRAPAAHDD